MNRHILSSTLSLVLLSACASTSPHGTTIVREFEANGVSRFILRARAANSAIVTKVIRDAPYVTASGIRSGETGRIHARVSTTQDTPLSERGLDFVSRRFGSTLVVSTLNETNHIGHRSRLTELHVIVPKPMRVIRKTRNLTADGAPDLSPP
jgi:hypothetical protein